MATIPAIRQALATQIHAQIPSLRSAPVVPGQVSPPVAVVRPSRSVVIEYEQSFGPGAMNVYFDVVLLAAAGSDRASQNLLDSFLATSGSTSVYAAVQADPTLGGIVSYAAVTRAQGYGMMEWAAVEYLSSTLIVEVGNP